MRPETDPFSLTVHSVEPPTADASRTSAGRLKMLLVLAICAAPVIASYLMAYVVKPHAPSAYGTLIQPTRTMPDMSLRDLQGRTVSAASLRRQWLLVTVSDAHCERDCEERLYLQRQLREMMGRERERVDRVWLVLDEAEVAPSLLQHLRETGGLVVLRARREDVAAWLLPEAGHALDEHLYIVDPMGEWMMRVPVAPQPSKLRRDLERLLRASASWDLPGR